MYKSKIEYVGEVGIDSGGLSKDWFLHVSRELVKPELCLFRPCADGTEVELDPRSAVVYSQTTGPSGSENVSGDQREDLKMLEFMGKLLAKAVYERQVVDVPLCRTLLKAILGVRPSLPDLKQVLSTTYCLPLLFILFLLRLLCLSPLSCRRYCYCAYVLTSPVQLDAQYFAGLTWMLRNPIDDVGLDETFTVTVEQFGVTRTVDLIPNGSNTPVTDANKFKFVRERLQWRTEGSVQQQLDALRNGFYSIIKRECIRVFTPPELSLLFGGKMSVKVVELRTCTQYTGGYEVDADLSASPGSEVINMLWEVLEGWTDVVRRKFLKFVTGTPRVPLDGYDPCFTVTRAGDDVGVDALPTAHTCFNQLVLPAYANKHILEEKLMFAVSNAGDGFMMT